MNQMHPPKSHPCLVGLVRWLVALSAILMVFVGLFWWAEPPTIPKSPNEKIRERLHSTMLPGIQFSKVPLSECMDQLITSMNTAMPSQTWTWSNADVNSPEQTLRLRTHPPLTTEERALAPRALDISKPVTITYGSATAAELLGVVVATAEAAHLRTGTHFTLYDPSDKTIEPLEQRTIDQVFASQFDSVERGSAVEVDITSYLLDQMPSTQLYEGDRALWTPHAERVIIHGGRSSELDINVFTRCIPYNPTGWELFEWKAKTNLQQLRHALFGPKEIAPKQPSPAPPVDGDPFGPPPEPEQLSEKEPH